MNLPPPSPLPGTVGNPQPYVIIADEAFKPSTNLLTAYPSFCTIIHNVELEEQ